MTDIRESLMLIAASGCARSTAPANTIPCRGSKFFDDATGRHVLRTPTDARPYARWCDGCLARRALDAIERQGRAWRMADLMMRQHRRELGIDGLDADEIAEMRARRVRRDPDGFVAEATVEHDDHPDGPPSYRVARVDVGRATTREHWGPSPIDSAMFRAWVNAGRDYRRGMGSGRFVFTARDRGYSSHDPYGDTAERAATIPGSRWVGCWYSDGDPGDEDDGPTRAYRAYTAVLEVDLNG